MITLGEKIRKIRIENDLNIFVMEYCSDSRIYRTIYECI